MKRMNQMAEIINETMKKRGYTVISLAEEMGMTPRKLGIRIKGSEAQQEEVLKYLFKDIDEFSDKIGEIVTAEDMGRIMREGADKKYGWKEGLIKIALENSIQIPHNIIVTDGYEEIRMLISIARKRVQRGKE